METASWICGTAGEVIDLSDLHSVEHMKQPHAGFVYHQTFKVSIRRNASYEKKVEREMKLETWISLRWGSC